MRSFGIDPGSRRTGWGIIERVGSQYRMIDCGVVSVSERRPLVERLEEIFKGLNTLIEQHQPEAVFLESIFHHKSARSALVLGHARGVAMLACGLHSVPLQELSPAEVKKAVTGRGRADKAQVQLMVQALLGLPEPAQEDASDALAVAFTGATRVQFSTALAQNQTRGQAHRGRVPSRRRS